MAQTGNWMERIGWFLVMIYLWFMLGVMIFKVDPTMIRDFGIPGFYLPFLLMLFFTIWVTVGRIRHATLKGLMWAMGITLFIGLRLVDLGHWLNLLLVGGVLVSMEVYWRSQRIDKKRV
jgi:hypothetical protein